MNQDMAKTWVAVIVSVVVGVAITYTLSFASIAIFGIKIGPQCPTKLVEYCQSWETKSSAVTDPDNHLIVTDEFRIRAKGWGVEPPIWIKAESPLTARWLGQSSIKLREIEIGGAVKCMVGRLNLADTHGTDHQWHQLTLWTNDMPSGSSTIKIMEICVSASGDGGWPNQCEMSTCLPAGPAGSHGGRAHAEK